MSDPTDIKKSHNDYVPVGSSLIEYAKRRALEEIGHEAFSPNIKDKKQEEDVETE